MRRSEEISFTVGQHRVTWRDGRLILHDHDIRDERLLRALGGRPCSCLLVLDALSTRRSGWAFGEAELAVLQEMTESEDFSRLSPAQRDRLLLRARRALVSGLAPGMAEVFRTANDLHLARRAVPPPERRERRDGAELLREAAAPMLERCLRAARKDL